MRTITVNHRNGLGKMDYNVYETKEQLLVDNPRAVVINNFSEARAGDYIVSQNGWVVPLIQVTELTNKYYKSGLERIKRNKVYTHRVFHFPMQRICVPLNKLDMLQFIYKPRDTKNISGTGARNRMYEVTVRKIKWAQHVANGIEPIMATEIVYPRVYNKNKLTKSLLLNDKLIAFIEEKTYGSLRSALDKSGINDNFIANLVKSIIDDKNEDVKLRSWALDFAVRILER